MGMVNDPGENYTIGYIKFYRLMFQHGIVGARKPYSKFEAWLWMIAEARYKEKTEIISFGDKDRTVITPRGSFTHSLRFLSNQFGWGINRTRNFLKLLQNDFMIVSKQIQQITQISICNYDIYQVDQQTNGYGKVTVSEQQSNSKSTEQIKEIKEIKEKNTIILWRNDFEIYKLELNKEFDRLINDAEFIAKQQELNPGLNIKLTLQKAKENYWIREVGWKKKKSSRSKTIDWEQTFINALSMPSNRVWKSKEEVEKENNGPRIIKDW